MFENIKRGDPIRASDLRATGRAVAAAQARPAAGAPGFVRTAGGSAQLPAEPPFFLARVNGRMADGVNLKFAFTEHWIVGDGPPVLKPSGRVATFTPRGYAVSTTNDEDIAVGDFVLARRHPADPALWEILLRLGPWMAYSGSASPAVDLVTVDIGPVVTNTACVGGQLQVTTKTFRVTGSDLTVSSVG